VHILFLLKHSITLLKVCQPIDNLKYIFIKTVKILLRLSIKRILIDEIVYNVLYTLLIGGVLIE